jgi:hypothetical protein
LSAISLDAQEFRIIQSALEFRYQGVVRFDWFTIAI